MKYPRIFDWILVSLAVTGLVVVEQYLDGIGLAIAVGGLLVLIALFWWHGAEQ